jgi:hypothetical protein
MKRPLIALLLFACLPLVCAQKVRYGQEPPKAKPGVDYPIRVQVSAIHIRQNCKTAVNGQQIECHNVVYADATLSEKKIELMGDWIWFQKYSALAVVPGDYKARILKSANSVPAFIGDQYELVLRENILWRCTVTGISE